MVGHRPEHRAYAGYDCRSTRVVGLESAQRVRQFLDGNAGMRDVPQINKLFDNCRRNALHLMNIYAGVEKKWRARNIL